MTSVHVATKVQKLVLDLQRHKKKLVALWILFGRIWYMTSLGENMPAYLLYHCPRLRCIVAEPLLRQILQMSLLELDDDPKGCASLEMQSFQ